jgi:Peptidase MA superfamily
MERTKSLLIFSTMLIILSGCMLDIFDYSSISPQKVFENRNFVWECDSSLHIKYYYAPHSTAAKNIDSIKIKSESYYEHALSLVHEINYPRKISLIFSESRSKMKELTSFESNGLANWKYNAIYYVYGDSLRINGVHEFNHVITTNLWGENDSYHWLSEGFAVYSDNSWGKYDLHLLCKYLLDKNRLLSIHELRNNFNDYSSLITYPQSGSFVKYLYEKYGYDKFKQFWQQGDGKVQNIYGKSFETLEQEWLVAIKTNDAQGINYKF